METIRRMWHHSVGRWALIAASAALLMLAAGGALLVVARVNQRPVSVTPARANQQPVSAAMAPLIGEVTRGALEAHPGWETLHAEDYTPNPAAIAAIREASAGIDVFVFLGTWCSDSQREVPRFFKIMDQAGLADQRTTLLGLDRSKKDPEGLAVSFGVQYVPTFIVFKEGREVGRIVERPVGTLEGDLAQIMSQAQSLASDRGLFAGGASCH